MLSNDLLQKRGESNKVAPHTYSLLSKSELKVLKQISKYTKLNYVTLACQPTLALEMIGFVDLLGVEAGMEMYAKTNNK